MLICETLLLCTILVLGVTVIRSDYQFGVIRNKALKAALIFGLCVNCFYLGFFVRPLIKDFLLNWVLISILAILLYSYHFWAAGDSKLLICISFLTPARYYAEDMRITGIYFIIYIFLTAYVYIIVDSILQSVKKKRFFKTNTFTKNNIQAFLKRYVISYLYLRALSILMQVILQESYYRNSVFFAFVNIFIVIMIHEKPVFKKCWMLAALVAINGGLAIYSVMNHQAVVSVEILRNYGIVVLALVLKDLVSGYNYEEIPTSSVEKGMVLSYSTVALFSASRVKGLPQVTYEDMRSRLTEEEASAIHRWGKSKYGKSSVVIVRKMPFAVFIIIGTVLFIATRLYQLCL